MSRRIFDILVSERVISLVEHVGTGALVFNQSAADLAQPELKPLLDVYGRGKDTNAADRQKLARAAWQLTGGTFGSRQQLYERLHSGDPYVLMARSYDMYDKRRAVDAVNRLLGTSFKP
jgi:aromatic ring hydroxylase